MFRLKRVHLIVILYVCEGDWYLENAESVVLTAGEHTQLNSEQHWLQQLERLHIRSDVMWRLQQVWNQTTTHVILTLETALNAHVLKETKTTALQLLRHLATRNMPLCFHSQSTRRHRAAHAPRPSHTSPEPPLCCHAARTASDSDTTPQRPHGCPPAHGTACSAPRPDTLPPSFTHTQKRSKISMTTILWCMATATDSGWREGCFMLLDYLQLPPWTCVR